MIRPPATAGRGAIAQLGERLDRTQEVAGSSPASSIPKELATSVYARKRLQGARSR